MQQKQETVLGADGGGTTARVAVWKYSSGEEPELVDFNEYRATNFPSLEDVCREFMKGRPPINAAGFGLAGPIRGGRQGACDFTNLNWQTSAATLAEALKLPLANVVLLNDMFAVSCGIPNTPADCLVTLNQGVSRQGNFAVIAAGTGLGQGGAVWDDHTQCHVPFASEGAHVDLAAKTPMQHMLLENLLSTTDEPVTYETVVCGAGLIRIYRFLRLLPQYTWEPLWLKSELTGAPDQAAVISKTALAERDPCCMAALDMFVEFYGAQAGNVAHHPLSVGGIYVAGGIATKILPKLTDGSFMRAFLAHKHRPILEEIPVHVVTDPFIGQRGAAFCAAQTLAQSR